MSITNEMKDENEKTRVVPIDGMEQGLRGT